MIKRIILPLFLWSIIYFYFFGFASGKGLFESINHSADQYKALLIDGILQWRNIVSGANHLWYLYVYSAIVILFPAFDGVRKIIDKYRVSFLKFFIVVVLILGLNDFSYNKFFDFSHDVFNGVLGAGIWSIAGYLFYKNLDRIKGKKSMVSVGCLMFFIANAARFLIIKTTGRTEILFWYTSCAMVAVVGIAVALYGLYDKIVESKIVSRVICRIGSTTFSIYLIHMMVVAALNALGFCDFLRKSFGGIKYGDVLYVATMIILVFAVSYALTELWRLFVKVFKYKARY